MGKEVPTIVKIISILNYIGAGFAGLVAVMLFVGSGFLGTLLASIPALATIPYLSLIGTLGSALFIFAGIMLLGMAVLSFFMARGLWRGKNWARIVQIVFCCFGILTGLISLSLASIVPLAVNGAIAGYLIFNKEVKKVFK
jgi:hypothetical protein